MLWLLPLLPLAVALLVFVGGSRTMSLSRSVVASLAIGGEVALLALAVWAAVAQPDAAWAWGPLLAPVLGVAGLARVMVVLVPAIAIPVVLYAASSERETPGLPRLLALLVAFTGAMELLVLAGDFLTLLVGWELVGACSWALITHDWRDPERPRAARDAFLTTRAGDLGLYLAAAAMFAGTGSLQYSALSVLHGATLHVVAGGLLLAATSKSAQLPFSPWLYRAMQGPTPASALLHSATMVAAGAYALARLAPALGEARWLAPTILGLGLATALAGGLVATLQRDLKKALAASTSAQYGLMFVAIGAGVPAAAGVHLVTHAAFKALLFLGAGVALHSAGTLDLGALALGRALRRTAILVWVGALALAAVPPFGGAYSKEQIVAAATLAGPWIATGVLIAGALSVLYAGRLALLAYGPPRPQRDGRGPRERGALASPSASELVALALLAAVTIALGVLWLPGAGPALARWMPGALAEGVRWATIAALLALMAVAWLVWWLWRRGLLLSLGVPAPAREWIAGWFALPAFARTVIVRPVLALSHRLAVADERVVDAGVRLAARIGRVASRSFAWWGERGFDGVVRGVSALGWLAARGSGLADDRGVDAAVEDVARGVGLAGEQSRRLQTGLAHHYYIIVAVGTVIAVAVAGWVR
jgi:NADH:ubiquinone oxidoreductase subunit 5 (subunit L)/multisubunit Na+/H+ antiporter MnhA subunit